MMRSRLCRAAVALTPLVSVVAVLVGDGQSAGASYGASGSPRAQPLEAPVSAPLAGSSESAGEAWVQFPMGNLGTVANTFWQLFVERLGQSTWSLATPPGVADNGGLVASPGGGTLLLTGFLPSQLLTFSPLASTTDGGHAWATGVLKRALVAVPDALASAPSRPVLALVTDHSSSSSEVLVSAGGLSSWRLLVSEAALTSSPGGRACGIRALSAVAYSVSGAPEVGAICSRPGVVGILQYEGGAWRLAGPVIRASAASGASSVLRLSVSGGIESALVATGVHGGVALTSAHSSNGRTWSVSNPLDLTGRPRMTSSGSVGDDGFVVTWTAGSRDAVATLSPATQEWSTLPDTPVGTQAVAAAGSPERFTAFVVDRSTLREYSLSVGAGRVGSWKPEGVVKVPVQYGSSS
jgi:hypothetical protein